MKGEEERKKKHFRASSTRWFGDGMKIKRSE
jgi:hypothetical protein